MNQELTPQLSSQLDMYRKARAFSPSFYLEAKLRLLRRYFKETHLSAAVIGVSGGIDSALTLAILKRLQDSPQSCLKKIIPVCLPFYDCVGATDQRSSFNQAEIIIRALGLELYSLDLGPIHQNLYQEITAAFDFNPSDWASGQLVSNLRTPVFYQIANQLHEDGLPCAVIGTINRDEGAYIGFFGKASDAMVDIQCISDLHKSEVYQLAKFLDIPQSILNARPTGNTYDGSIDEHSFGFSYDFLEWYSYYLQLSRPDQHALINNLDTESRDCFNRWSILLEKRHHSNRHKYFTPAQGLHFDVYTKALPNGWRDEILPSKPLNLNQFYNLFPVNQELIETFKNYNTGLIKSKEVLPYVHEIENILSSQEINTLLQRFHETKTAYADNHGKPSLDGHQYRATTYSPDLAEIIFKRINHFLDTYLSDDGYQPIDGGKDTIWRLVGISPLFRFIAYEPDGELVGHFDEGYQDGKQKTLFSLIVYFTTQSPGTGGETVILLDVDRNKPCRERAYLDDEISWKPDHELHRVLPQAGNGLILAHRIKHGVRQNHSQKNRIILRMDIVYESLGPNYLAPPKYEQDFGSVTRDVFYRSYFYTTQSLTKTKAAGFIDNAAIHYQSPWSILPLQKLNDCLENISLNRSQEYIVLLSTGGFCPLHAEHIRMMEQAKKTLEGLGKKVLGGFLSPSHKRYLETKPGVVNYSTQKHINSLKEAVSQSSWIDLWLWECLEHEKPINFTDVIVRLENELALHVKTTLPIKVAYVFGGDNARFHYAFIERGISICVNRSGYEDRVEEIKRDPLFRGNENIYCIDNPHPLSLSSEQSRKSKPFTRERKCSFFHLRTDDINCEHWNKNNSFSLNIRYFLDELINILYKTFGKYEPNFTVEVASASLQNSVSNKVLEGKRILSIDPCYHAEYNLGISRYFRFGLPETKLGFGPRPEAPSLEQQLNDLPKQPYCLVDDDSFTGETLDYLRALLAKEHGIEEIYLAMNHHSDNNTKEIGDLRDFIVGSKFGGLVMKLPNKQIARVPYIYPFVLPSNRYQCPAEENIRFSLALWKLNKSFFSDAKSLLIAHCEEPFINLAEYLGFSKQYSLYDFCAFYVNHLTQLEYEL